MPWFEQDIPAAKKLLAEAGYANGIEVKIDIQNVPYAVTTVQVMKEMWAKAGIIITINAMPSGQYWDLWYETPMGFSPWTHRALGVQLLALAYRSGVPWNETRSSNKEFDNLLDKAEGTFDVEARRQIMKRIRATRTKVYVPGEGSVDGAGSRRRVRVTGSSSATISCPSSARCGSRTSPAPMFGAGSTG